MNNLICVLSKFSLYYGLPDKISYGPNEFLFLMTFCFSHLVGQSEQFDTREKLPWGASQWPIGTFVPFFV